jgi:hypothetical protein
VKLRDDPTVVNIAALVTEELPAPPSVTPAASPPAAAEEKPVT